MKVRLKVYTFGNGTKVNFGGNSLEYAKRKASKIARCEGRAVIVEVHGNCGWEFYREYRPRT